VEDVPRAVCRYFDLKCVESYTKGLCNFFTFHISSADFPSMSDKKRKNPAPKVSTPPVRRRSFDKVPTGEGFVPWLAEMCRRRGFVKWLAAYIRISRRDLAYLAAKGIPGVTRSGNNYNFDWSGDPPELAKWIRNRKRSGKGNRRRPKKHKKRKKRLTQLDWLERAIRRVNILVATDAVRIQIRRAPEDRLRRLEVLLLPTQGVLRTIDIIRRTAHPREPPDRSGVIRS
jgi:hypothetical protein